MKIKVELDSVTIWWGGQESLPGAAHVFAFVWVGMWMQVCVCVCVCVCARARACTCA